MGIGCSRERLRHGIDACVAVAAALSEQRDAIEEVIEPFLLQQGLIQRTPRGRMLTEIGFARIGQAPPASWLAPGEPAVIAVGCSTVVAGRERRFRADPGNGRG